ncbi:hypothetical protein DCAR_0519779 [Daucus carota subsp. sativus]|uniref:Uncharacterized protein n=1 Tax=Daucus carota subsp. sativus TaxID=79200 RepID=A0A164Y6J4_DAUCS|nr:hypothetical protein DCAR_0519779 [Daucus carota subsp. sativus]
MCICFSTTHVVIIIRTTSTKPANESTDSPSNQSCVYRVSQHKSASLDTGMGSAAYTVEDAFASNKQSRPMFGSNENLDPNIQSGACIGVLFLPIQLDVISVEFFLGLLIACAVGFGCHVWIAGGIF